MINESKVRALVDETIKDTDIFLVDLKIGGGNRISVSIDAIGGLPITDCIKVSRGIEEDLDREEEDFSLDVSSPGLDKPFKVFRQYEKNIDRSILVKLEDGGVFDAKILSVNDADEKITVVVEQIITIGDLVENLKKGDNFELSVKEIIEARINISFS